MKNVTFDTRLITHPGIGRYIRSLLKAMLRLESDFRFILVGSPQALSMFENQANVELRPCHIPIYGFREQSLMHRYYGDADVVHIPHFNIPFITHPRFVVTIHDLIYFHVREYQPFPGSLFLLRQVLNRVARKASRIITVSDSTSRDCERLFPSMKGKLKRIYEAADPFFFDSVQTVDARKKFGLKNPYVLSVGSIREHKNIQGLLKAYRLLLERSPMDLDLVLCGKVDSRFARKYDLDQITQKSGTIHILEKVDDDALKSLYRNASCFVMPSFYEGFGLPVLEAMASRVPVISSNASSLPEIVGDTGLTCDPAQIDQLAQLLYNVLSDKELQQNLISKAYDKAHEFSWDKAARETLDVYEEVLCSGGVS